MIQRIQTVYLLLSVIAMALCLSLQIALFEGSTMGAPTQHMYNLFIQNAGEGMNFTVVGLAVALIAAIILSIINIFGYKNLQRQSHQCLMTMLVLILWMGGYAIIVKEMCPDGYTQHIEIAAALPLVAFIFQWLARRGIRHDINMLKAADRIR